MLPDSIATRPTRFPTERLPLIEVADWLHIGQGVDGISSSVQICTDEGRVLVNCGRNGDGATLRSMYDEVDPGPIRYVIVTQGHGDHFGGFADLRDAETKLVGHEEIWRSGEDWRLLPRHKARRLDAWMQPHGWFPAVTSGNLSASLPVVDISVADEWAVTLGGREIRVLAMPGAESNEQLVVWLPAERALIAGNLFGAIFGHIPNLQTMRGDRLRDPMLIIRSIDRLLALDAEILVVGHHGPVLGVDQVRESMTRVRDALQYVHDETIAGLEAGRSVTELMASIVLPTELAVLEGYGRVDWAVRAVATLYQGWFEGETTTELLPVDRADLGTELIGLISEPRAVLERADELAAAGELGRALQLVEALLQADRRDPEVVEAYRAIHAALLAGAEEYNHWLSPWLAFHASPEGPLPAVRRAGRVASSAEVVA